MIYTLNIIVFSVLIFLTTSLLPYLKILGVTPLLPLFFIIPTAYFRKGFEPIALAAFAGIFLDIFSAYHFGFYLATFLLTVAIVRLLFQEGMRVLSFGTFIFITLSVLTTQFAYQVGYLYFNQTELSWFVLLSFGKFLLINAFFAALVYAFSVWYFERIQLLNNILKRR